MPRRIPTTFWNRAFQRQVESFTRQVVRHGTRTLTRAVRSATVPLAPAPRRRAAPTKPASPGRASTGKPGVGSWTQGLAMAPGGMRRYWLYKPAGVRRTEPLPLLVMLHGCGQDAETLAASSRMNRLADRERFLVLYPEQDRLHNAQGCWNWYETRSGKAQVEAGIIEMAIDQVCLVHGVDPKRIALAGLSAGAGMAALLATRRPGRYRAIAMHSGVPPGAAHSTATALSAMRGRRTAPTLPNERPGVPLPGLLVIQGTADQVVAEANGSAAVELWARHAGALPRPSRVVQRGLRHPATLTDYRTPDRRLAATLCTIEGLGHAWSGGAPGRDSDPRGPDASRMIWAFCKKQFEAVSSG